MEDMKQTKMSFIMLCNQQSYRTKMPVPKEICILGGISTASTITVQSMEGTYNFDIEVYESNFVVQGGLWTEYCLINNIKLGDYIFFDHIEGLTFQSTIIKQCLCARRYKTKELMGRYATRPILGKNRILSFIGVASSGESKGFMVLPKKFVERAFIELDSSIFVRTDEQNVRFSVEDRNGNLMLNPQTWREFIEGHEVDQNAIIMFHHDVDMEFEVTILNEDRTSVAFQENESDITGPEIWWKAFDIKVPSMGTHLYHYSHLASLCIPKAVWQPLQFEGITKAYLLMERTAKEVPIKITWKRKSRNSGEQQCFLTHGWPEFSKEHNILAGQRLEFTVTNVGTHVVRMAVEKIPEPF